MSPDDRLMSPSWSADEAGHLSDSNSHPWQASSETIVRFDKLGHTASVSLRQGWGMNDERVIARENGADICATLTLANLPIGALITVYVVGGPDVKAITGDPGGAAFEVLTIAPPGTAAAAPSTDAPRTVDTPMAGRYLAACVPNGSTMHLRCVLSFCLYALYVTNEPPATK